MSVLVSVLLCVEVDVDSMVAAHLILLLVRIRAA